MELNTSDVYFVCPQLFFFQIPLITFVFFCHKWLLLVYSLRYKLFLCNHAFKASILESPLHVWR